MNTALPNPLGQPALPRLHLGTHLLTVDSITTHGAARAMVSVRGHEDPDCPAASAALTRDALVAFALGILDLSEHLVEDGAYHTSDSVRDGQATVSTRHRDGLRRYFRIRDRLPILQLAQRVLEKADDNTARKLLILLGHADATGQLPLEVNLDLTATPKLRLVSQNEQSEPSTP